MTTRNSVLTSDHTLRQYPVDASTHDKMIDSIFGGTKGAVCHLSGNTPGCEAAAAFTSWKVTCDAHDDVTLDITTTMPGCSVKHLRFPTLLAMHERGHSMTGEAVRDYLTATKTYMDTAGVSLADAQKAVATEWRRVVLGVDETAAFNTELEDAIDAFMDLFAESHPTTDEALQVCEA